MAKNPTSILFARLADEHLRRGEVGRATEICRRGLRYRPSYSTGHLVLGQCHQAAGRLEEARQEFQKVLQLDSDNLAAFLYIGRLEAALGNPAHALWHLRRALLLDPFNDVLAAEIEAMAPSRPRGAAPASGQAEAVIPHPAEAGSGPEVDDEPGPGPADDGSEGQEALEAEGPAGNEGAVSGPSPSRDQPFLSFTLAELYAAQGHTGRAVGVLRRLLELDPENGKLKGRLGELETVQASTGGHPATSKERA